MLEDIKKRKMLPKWHIAINAILFLILLFFVPLFPALIFFLSSVLIDIDHYLYYIYEKRDFSLIRAYKWNKITRKRYHNLSREEKKRHRYFVLVFHGVEVLLILLILSEFFPVLFFVFLGFFVHMVQDVIIAFRFDYLKRKLFLTYAIYIHNKHRVK
jgi:hypothetical protein